MTREVYFLSLSEKDAYALIFLAFLFFLSFIVFVMRGEIVDVIRELLRRDKREFTASKKNFIFSFLFNIILLLAILFFIGIHPQNNPPEIHPVQVASSNQSFVSNNTAIIQTTQGVRDQTVRAEGILYKYTSIIAIVTLSLTALSVLLAFREKSSTEDEGSYLPFQTKLLQDTRVALEDLKSNKDTRAIIIELYNSLCRELIKLKVRVKNEMTAREIMKETLSLIPYIPYKPLESLTFLFEKARYSNHTMLQEDKEKAEKALTEIVCALESGIGNGEKTSS